MLTWLRPMAPAPSEQRPSRVERVFLVLRCALVAVVAYQLAAAAGLQHPIWAPMSALIVSQGTREATLRSVWSRCLGTLAGVLTALLVNAVSVRLDLGVTLQMAVAVGLCAALTVDRPHLRVSLWTCPLVLGSDGAGHGAVLVAASRVIEVLLGVLVGGLLAVLSEPVQASLARKAAPSTAAQFGKEPGEPLTTREGATAPRRHAPIEQQ